MGKLQWFPKFARSVLRIEPVARTSVAGRPRVEVADISPRQWIIDTGGLTPRQEGELFDEIAYAMEDGDVEFLRQFRFLRNPRFARIGRIPIPALLQRQVYARDGGRCCQCESREDLQFDHVVPVAHGGETTLANLQLLCRACNWKKGPKSWERRRRASANG